MTKISAHGLRPPLLGFSIHERDVLLSTSNESQNLQIVRFSAGLCRICALRETALKSVSAWREVFAIALCWLLAFSEALCSEFDVDEAS
jgi:hypothetical protein